METKFLKIRRNILIYFVLFPICFFSSCQQKPTKKNEVFLWGTVYKLEIPAFTVPLSENIATRRQISVFYVITSNGLLDCNDILVEKTDNLLDTLKMVCADTVYNDTTNILEYFYECYSNKYLDVIYIPIKSYKEYYPEIQDFIKNTELIFNGDILQKSEKYKEYFMVELVGLPNHTQIYPIDNPRLSVE